MNNDIELINLKNIITEQVNFPYIKNIDIYNNTLVYIDIMVNDVLFTLDITKHLEISLIFRFHRARNLFSSFYGFDLPWGEMIFDGKKITQPWLKIDLNNLHDFISILNKIIIYFSEIISSNSVKLNSIESKLTNLNYIRLNTENHVWEDMVNYLKPRQISILDTLKKIRDEKLSISRYGDGEIRCMLTRDGCIFQKHDWKLMRELRDICLNIDQSENLLVCFPYPLHEIDWWHNFWVNYWFKCKFYLNQDILGNAFITRMEAFQLFDQEVVNLWKEIFSNKRVCFITGESSRLDVNHSIFSTIKNYKLIVSKNTDAYEYIDSIMEDAQKIQNDVDMFLIALGPTGTVLAARLAKLGMQALDIGHLNNSYDTVYLGIGTPEEK